MAGVHIKDVDKSYDGTQVLFGVNVDISDSEFIVIVGPSGCGKSTLLRMVAGLEVITAGEIIIDGRRVNDLEPKDRDIAMVFQNYALYPHMNVFDNMAYGLKLRGMEKTEIRTKVEQTAALLGLVDLLERKPRQLSGGQRQRVAMGRAIVREPAVFLFDEPLSNLDAKLRVRMRFEIRNLQRRLGVTSLYVTHDQVEAMTMADRLVVMNAGVAEQIGTPMEIYTNPQTRFVAGFIGSPSMNFFNCPVENGAAHLSSIRVPVPAGIGDEIIVGVRPEHFYEDAVESVNLDVLAVEPLGADTLVHGNIHDHDEDVVVRLDGHRDALGGMLKLGIKADQCYLFDVVSGARIRTGL
ncbi:MAG: sn-glycerol-3-phosphate import ATP-binding protein UgpC [marine bacterium B5-7]|nr:MAG: sn-glycerol-3-phosphate import ATP-binding protein UgpC [marine bacterium B5-7]